MNRQSTEPTSEQILRSRYANLQDSDGSSDEHDQTEKGDEMKEKAKNQAYNPLADPQLGTAVKRKSKAISNMIIGGSST